MKISRNPRNCRSELTAQFRNPTPARHWPNARLLSASARRFARTRTRAAGQKSRPETRPQARLRVPRLPNDSLSTRSCSDKGSRPHPSAAQSAGQQPVAGHSENSRDLDDAVKAQARLPRFPVAHRGLCASSRAASSLRQEARLIVSGRALSLEGGRRAARGGVWRRGSSAEDRCAGREVLPDLVG